uniref:Uncharacterized protein n=1 Tax=Klebsiella quasipneumoniae TaxID=1463165 RepID=A0A7L7THV4_9ENTR|nr:Hypothetical protein [Klebsiella quasipneumoniae]
MFLPGRTGDARPFNRTSHTVDHCLQHLPGLWVVACSRHPLFLPGITGYAWPFNRTSHTVDHYLSEPIRYVGCRLQ